MGGGGLWYICVEYISLSRSKRVKKHIKSKVLFFIWLSCTNYMTAGGYVFDVEIVDLVNTRVLILDGNTEIVVQVRSNLSYLICFRHLISSRIKNRFLPGKTFSLHGCATYSELPADIRTMVSSGKANIWCIHTAGNYVLILQSFI